MINGWLRWSAVITITHFGDSYKVPLLAEGYLPKKKTFVIELSRAGIIVKKILKVLKERDASTESTIPTIYNTQAKLKHDPIVSARSQRNSSDEVDST
ncbi:hypothetical protein IFM89_038732 [Coptis chinensis]|uniref:Uncharacterized protein n=1 Tax=Coptis chinensis TaxID=261450 RepID=A0A835LNZ2_9MAGN|nr:hypothetical protein IFM89_038732 [Coptis chinensis]